MLDPGAAIGGEFQLTTIATIDGRLLSGIIQDQNEASITIQTANDQLILPREDLDEVKAAGASMMPEGLLDKLSPEEVRDLFSYLCTLTGAASDRSGLSGASTKPLRVAHCRRFQPPTRRSKEARGIAQPVTPSLTNLGFVCLETGDGGQYSGDASAFWWPGRSIGRMAMSEVVLVLPGRPKSRP